MEHEGATRAARLAAAATLESFVAAHYARLIRLACLVSLSVDEAEDAVQAALERAWRSHASLRDRERLRPWLDQIVVREAIRTGRRKRPQVLSLQTQVPAVRDSLTTTAAVHVALEALSAEHRAAVVLHLYLGYSVPETAEVLAVPIETVRSRLRVARDRLRRLLAEEG